MGPVKFLFLFEDPEKSFFFEKITDENYNRLNDVYIGQGQHQKLEDELCDMVWDKEGNVIVKQLEKPTKDWDHFVKCGSVV